MYLPRNIRNSNDGVKEIFKQLDLALEEDPLGDMFEAYDTFDNITRKEGETINEYIYRYADIREKLEKNDIRLPDSILSYRLLKGANLDDVTERMVRTNCRELNLAEVQLNLKKATDSHLIKIKKNIQSESNVVIKQ